jgi:hypothetical protein
MSDPNLTLAATRIEFLSELDETSFFQWLAKLSCIERYYGDGDSLKLVVSRAKVDEASLLELVALFFRYGIDLRQLRVFRNENTETWLFRPGAYWFDKMFT